jgi:hypothetical protein
VVQAFGGLDLLPVVQKLVLASLASLGVPEAEVVAAEARAFLAEALEEVPELSSSALST